MSAMQSYKGITFLPIARCTKRKYTCYPVNSTSSYNTNLNNFCWFCQGRPTVKYSRIRGSIVKSVVDGGTSESSSSNTTNNGGTRLFNALKSLQTNLYNRINRLRKGLSLKILFFLIGFYCATAFATVIGQTGDWDILSAGLAVVVVEGIGALMYRASIPVFKKIGGGLITIFNYWKAGLSLGLFLDAFKYEIDSIFESCGTPFDFQIDIFPGFW
ncbi:ycf20-like protein isoform X1 [Carex littledalei]|uniref:Ycf20-like protein isoform X1 n=1 Tax=Carex littledalei TaxID=544730 RepID=A0A833RHV8_9POAL|nr:ycf20-like protein isoform X1 [Carex littledalei]